MAVVVMDSEDLEALIRQVVVDTVKANAISIPDKERPYLTMEQFMELMDISRPKAIEVMKKPGFPVTREFGHPRIITALLHEWVSKNVEQ